MPEDKGLPTATKSIRAEKEEKILEFWKEHKVFEETLKKPSPEGDFVFYEGPPTANAKPALHHIEARTFKDAVPRYKTMQGFRVRRKAGWDTHGLPVELQIEKKLGLTSKKDIEAYGVAKFNKECKDSVFEYIGDWSKFTDRIGYWVDLNDAYFTFDNSYIQSVWSVLKNVSDQNLLYKDYKVLPWCPRCGTALSSHELAQGYADVKDLSVYAKFKIIPSENGNEKSSGRFAQPDLSVSILAWTTTPWTLPGNLALAVGKDIDYVLIKLGSEHLILAESRLGIVDGEYEIVEKMKGSELVGLEYEALYPYIQESITDEERPKLEKAYRVYEADFVTTEDGTGVVHTAVMYGQDDFELGTKIGLPKFHIVDDTGHFTRTNGPFSGKFVKDEETAVDIIKDLAHRGLLFKKEKHEHSYPHCWRCKTPLIYYARDSWYIRMSALRDDLVKENEKINWEPNYIKEGRFGDWLREIKDWAISRERYWGTPMPIWESPSGKKLVIGSLEEMKEKIKTSGNTFFVMRHGETKSNIEGLTSYKHADTDGITEKGRKEVLESAEGMKDKGIDLIISSPFRRAKETAEITAEVLGLSASDIVYDDRIKEINPGDFDGGIWKKYHEAISNIGPEWFTHTVPNGESYKEVLLRVGAFIYDVENTYKDKNILIVTHGSPAWLLYVVNGLFTPEKKPYAIPEVQAFVDDFKRFTNAEMRELSFLPLPHNENFELDLHKPYIDEVELEYDGEPYKRVKEVMDVWFDSGSVPFAQDSKTRSNPVDFSNILYPADFISEAIDQTRGWFYTLHAIGVLMGKGHSFKNAICLGHILDKEGKKMSKSIGNIVDPWVEIDTYGVDTLRLWMYSVNQPGESKNYDARSVDEIQKRVFNLLDNMYTFYELYRDNSLESNDVPESQNVLDQWILERLSEVTTEMTKKLDDFKLLEPVRELRAFIDDFSTWYVRRSRDRLKDGDAEAKRTMYFVLKTVSKVLAPFAPFAAEDLYQKLRLENDPRSVHLEKWPEVQSINPEVILNMSDTRRIASAGLEARSRANIKIRQPLASLSVRLGNAYADIIRDEVNVKEVIPSDIDNVLLDTELSPLLIEEGKLRELVRSIQEKRKEAGLSPKDTMTYVVPDTERDLFDSYREEIQKTTNIISA
jgi:isoleucyl-tRNA synthetase